MKSLSIYAFGAAILASSANLASAETNISYETISPCFNPPVGASASEFSVSIGYTVGPSGSIVRGEVSAMEPNTALSRKVAEAVYMAMIRCAPHRPDSTGSITVTSADIRPPEKLTFRSDDDAKYSR